MATANGQAPAWLAPKRRPQTGRPTDSQSNRGHFLSVPAWCCPTLRGLTPIWEAGILWTFPLPRGSPRKNGFPSEESRSEAHPRIQCLIGLFFQWAPFLTGSPQMCPSLATSWPRRLAQVLLSHRKPYAQLRIGLCELRRCLGFCLGRRRSGGAPRARLPMRPGRLACRDAAALDRPRMVLRFKPVACAACARCFADGFSCPPPFRR
jgi:hypothetical protein